MDKPLPQLKNGEQTVYFQAGGEWCFLRTPRSFKADRSASGAVPCVIRVRGYGAYVKEGEADWDREGRRLQIDMLVDRGVAVAGSQLTGDHWGRPAAIAANWALYALLIGKVNVDPKRIGMITGGGMGGAALWNSIIGPLAGRVKAAVLLQGVVSLESMVTHRLRPNLLEAYGLPVDTPNDVVAACIAGSDPLARTQLLLAANSREFARSLPKVLYIHGDKDPDVPYEKNPVPLSKLLKGTGADFTLKTYEGRGHDVHLLGEPVFREISDFFQKAFAS